MGPNFSSHLSSSSENNFTFSTRINGDNVTRVFNDDNNHGIDVDNDNVSRFSDDDNNQYGKRKMPEFIDFLSPWGKYDDDQDDQISTTLSLNLLDQADPDVKMKQILTVSEDHDHPKRKAVPQLIDFNWSCSNNDDQKKPDPEQESSEITSMELELNLGFFKKRKIESTSSNEPNDPARPAPIDTVIDHDIRGNIAPIPIHVHQQALMPDDRHQDHWNIRKVLTKSDINGSSRLLLSKDLVRAHILPHVVDNQAVLVDNEGATVRIWDVDTRSEHELVLITWKGTGSYVLKKNWGKDFVKRRGLKESHEIGLRWDDHNSRLEFTLFNQWG